MYIDSMRIEQMLNEVETQVQGVLREEVVVVIRKRIREMVSEEIARTKLCIRDEYRKGTV